MTQQQPAGRRIVVGVDESESARRALQWALAQARLTGAEVEAVHSWQVPASFGVVPAVLPDEDPTRAAEQALATAVERATGGHPEVTVRRRVLSGHPAAVLVEQAEGADLLVVGSHGHGGFMGALLGSVSMHCVQHAPCPVVVVR